MKDKEIPQLDMGYPVRLFIPCVCQKYPKHTVLYNKRVIDSAHADMEDELTLLTLYPDADISPCAYIISRIIEDYANIYKSSSIFYKSFHYQLSYNLSPKGTGVDITITTVQSFFEHYDEYIKNLYDGFLKFREGNDPQSKMNNHGNIFTTPLSQSSWLDENKKW